ncbi:MAG TPA: glucose 1-dehydrogenase [Devosiaceae bacterium]|jgi:NAD(P)-dependent dehydrogenase (short-subunit alcohol dehydrogenase family)
MILDRFRLDGQVVLITGGTRGIGLAIAQALGEAGARLIVSSKTPRPEAMAVLQAAGLNVDYIQADMLEPKAPAALVHAAIAQAGRLDILVANAGVASHGASEEFTDERWRVVMTTNVDAVFRCARAAISQMRRQGGGVILNIGSISGIISNIPQQQVAYNASKAAVHMMTKSLASELADQNIRVNAIAPGYITTDMTNSGLADPEWGPVWRQMTPMGRPGTAEEVATAALFLCSPASSYVTGEVLVVDGGYTAR